MPDAGICSVGVGQTAANMKAVMPENAVQVKQMLYVEDRSVDHECAQLDDYKAACSVASH